MQASPAGQRVSDYTGAAFLGSLPVAEWMIADRGYDADWFRDVLKDKGIRPCILGRKSRGKAVRYDKRRYKRRNRLLTPVNMRCPVTDRDHVRSAEGLATQRHPLRPMRRDLPLCHRLRRHRHLLALTINESGA